MIDTTYTGGIRQYYKIYKTKGKKFWISDQIGNDREG